MYRHVHRPKTATQNKACLSLGIYLPWSFRSVRGRRWGKGMGSGSCISEFGSWSVDQGVPLLCFVVTNVKTVASPSGGYCEDQVSSCRVWAQSRPGHRECSESCGHDGSRRRWHLGHAGSFGHITLSMSPPAPYPHSLPQWTGSHFTDGKTKAQKGSA